MSLHLQRDLDQLRKDVLELGDRVESSINNAILMLNDRRLELFDEIIKQEEIIDDKEVQIEEFCLKILALHQPVAVDLRFIVVVLKVNNDLERMGDFAVNVAKRVNSLSSNRGVKIPQELSGIMSKTIRTMVRNSIESLVSFNIDLARGVIQMDDKVDTANRKMYASVESLVQADPSVFADYISLLSCSRYLERIADLATNIAEDVIFMVEGDVVRHQ